MNDKFMALFFLFPFWSSKQMTEGKRASPSAEHTKLKWPFSMKPADKQLASVSSASGILNFVCS